MKRQSSFNRLRGTVSALALSTAAMMGVSAQPAAALDEIRGGGSSLVSLAMRQLMDCYGTGFDTCSFTVAPVDTNVQGAYAAVGSGNGFRGFISNDPKQFFLGTPVLGSTGTVTMPAVPPEFTDIFANINTYPYAKVDFGASDSPLSTAAAPTTASYSTFTPTPWCTDRSCDPVTVSTSGPVTYDTANFGAPRQVPLIEAPVAIAINTNGFGTNNSALTVSPVVAGQAVQLTTAQICAIFSGAVNNWNATDSIASMNSSGTLGTQVFYAANVGSASGSAVGTPTIYASNLPIRVVYRSDGSGTSFIITNYLKSVCPQLDTGPISSGGNGYSDIFNATSFGTVALPSLPSTSFGVLISRINTVRGINVTSSTYNSSNPWIGVDGSDAIAQNINNVATDGGSTTYSGRIGYLSVDFTQPYRSSGSYYPLSASVQNEAQRAAGTYLPASTSGGSNLPTFIQPKPSGADLAFGDLSPPPSPSTHADWDLYSKKYPSPTNSGGRDLAGLSILGIPKATDAYPIVGTAFAGLYSCYMGDGGGTRADRVKAFFSWIYTSDAELVLNANGFGRLTNINGLRTAALDVVGGIEAAGSGGCATASGG
ncbi:substrate-binding domain-containing protein [Microbacteriaceae bacterium K1510]|nr:substrate-binding domain-containing protein [Microbacteriaceae bacterium K1510]